MKADKESLLQALEEAGRRLCKARNHRDSLIVEATAAGLTRREVGRAVGLTRAGVQYIVEQSRVESDE